MTFEKQKHFSLRKLKFGLVSVAIIAFLFAVTKTAEADETVITEQRQTSKINASSQKVENQTSNQVEAKTDSANKDPQEKTGSVATDAPSMNSANNMSQSDKQNTVNEISSDSQQTSHHNHNLYRHIAHQLSSR